MKRARCLPGLFLLLLAGCGENTAHVAQAAARAASETTEQLVKGIAELAQTTPEAAKQKLQELVDAAARELREVQDSATAQRIASEVQGVLDELVRLGTKLGQKLDLAGLRRNVEELVQRFREDPRVVRVLQALQEKLDELTR